MSEPRLSIHSDKAHALALRLAQRDNKTVEEIVERALEAYEARREPAAAFYDRLATDYGGDIDLDAIIREGRKTHSGPDL